ncbi:hypothetical protein CFS9_27510 [Flavobacterium sp. CFS9]|uniref:DUF4252 domain-containing protein n=1 Tax=Flavobacterium sp. CFS9 TaxID=3143118 RepID=A0AAT9H3S4_9FLAO
MKKLLLLFVTLLYTSLVDAQIIDNKTLEPKLITKASIMGATLIEANWYDNYTSFIFQDSKYQILNVQAKFILTPEEIDSFYSEVKNRFNKDEYKDNEGFIFQTKEGTAVHANFKKSMGTKSLYIAISKNNIVSLGMYLTKKQTKKLFNDQSN